MKKYLYKILRKIGFKWCNCGKFIWFSKKTLRWIESPKDEYGYTAPACDNCIFYASEKYPY